jgi:hypothetical protein
MSEKSEQRIITRAALVAEADTWLATPWGHMQAEKGVAVDCLGFLRGIARFVGHTEAPFEAYNRVTDERQEERGWRMIRLLDENLIRLKSKFDARVGDWFALIDPLSQLPQHVGMVRRYDAREWQMIHATLNDGVRFNRLDRRYLRLVHAAYQVPGVRD